MGKRLIIQILLFCLIALSLGAKSWRIEIRPFFEKAKDYEGLVSYIEKRFKRIPPVDQGLALIVISFAFSELNDSVSEAIHIQRYFKNYETPGADFEFLGSRNAMLLHEYILAWNRRYPGIRNVSISKEDRVFPYFAEKNRIALILDSRAPCVLEISGMDRELFSGYLKRGRNRIELNHVEDMKRRKKTVNSSPPH